MCGICGVYQVGTGEPVPVSLLKKMADTIIHRGPDDEGFFTDGPIGLAHRRLSIIDLEGGHQPQTNEDQTIWVIFNGEIYNFQALREFLIQKGHTLKSRSDTEVIVHLYEEKGEDCFRELRGMFAIALWDSQKRQLILARDRVGKKPLFYAYDKGRVVFGSEMKAVLAAPDVSREVDLEALSDYISLLYVPAPKSIFKAVRKVLPGHYVVISDRGLRDEEYWDIDFSRTVIKSEREWCEQLLDTYREAVQLRLISEVPLGAFLSGGVDSSSVVGLMTQITGKPVTTTSIGFEEQEFDELDYARQVANQFGSQHYEHVVRPDAVGITEKLAWFYDEPFGDSSSIPTYYVSQLAREHVTVALSGDGGDEFFAGYRRYIFDNREQQIRSLLPNGLRRWVFGMLASIYPKADWAPRVFRGKATFQNLACSHIEAYFRSISAVKPELKRELLHPGVFEAFSGYETLALLASYYQKARNADPTARIQYVDVKTYLPDDILVKVDRASMAHSLEVRAPILDHHFMELAASIPASLKLQGTSGKRIFKKSLEGLLSPDVLYRSKMGFGVPLARWFRHDLKQMASDIIFSAQKNEWLDRKTVRKIWEQHQSGLRDRSTELWAIFMLHLWRRQFDV
ncbi:MAG: asparagine synthase (glutamine-hydrolyzing) [Nitrospirales bacterium]|nr:asparagine synthase (glutamine-hydrolyzing) [Nitrospira sp.]MDR4501904.1 asparagine synthase (glutamine-hydrolyzing) [Nitrospirales bacterium]